ncbi:hypothetical protein RUM43_001778 [Polyplax serrata]|uniref:CCDC66 domain-containing protein n=1 Tax=Polyplax serrata TaxID=468196 RepID=A0AAN8SGR4_POLSC
MLATSKNLSLVEQKKLQWAKEREELVGLCGLWGRPKSYLNQTNKTDPFYAINNLLPPISAPNNEEPRREYRAEEESETSGYLSDSPKRGKQVEPPEEYQQCLYKETDASNNEESGEDGQQRICWNELERTDGTYWAEKKMYKNYKNESWSHQNNDFAAQNAKLYRGNKNYWYGTPESVSSDDGCRLKWGDRGIGIGHLWDPVVHQPDCRLPQVTDQYRPTPKWVEKGLKNHDGSRSEILIISHPDDDHFDYKFQKNFLLGQNAPIPPEVMEERERKRKKALEHQNAIKKQLEEREFKRKQEKEKRIQEEKLEEERIKKEQEIERLRYEEEQRKIKEKEEFDKKREEAMKEAIEMAEKRAREEKKRNKRQAAEDERKNSCANKEKFSKVEKTVPLIEMVANQRKQSRKSKRTSEVAEANVKQPKEEEKKVWKDSSSQFEEIQLTNSFQLLNMNGLPVDGGLALMLDNTPKDSGFILPPEGVQLALLMSPRNTAPANQIIPLSPPFSESVTSGERTLTPSKYRINQRYHYNPSNKSTQTDFRCSSGWIGSCSAGKRRRLNLRYGKTGNSVGVQKSGNVEKVHKHSRHCTTSKHRSKASKVSLEDRPKWGINRPSVQYMKQSEKDPYYQKKLKEKLKNNAEVALLSSSSDQTIKNEEEVENLTEKELNSVVRLLELRKDVDDGPTDKRAEIILQNGFRMNSNLSSPVFVPIDNRIKVDWKKSKKLEEESDKSTDTPRDNEDMSETEEEKTVESETERFLTPLQLDAIAKISNLREVAKDLAEGFMSSITSS